MTEALTVVNLPSGIAYRLWRYRVLARLGEVRLRMARQRLPGCKSQKSVKPAAVGASERRLA